MTGVARIVAVVLVALAAAAFGPAGRPELGQIERCRQLIALFDEIVQTRADVRVLSIDLRDLEEARAWRRRAEAHCDAGRFWFGVGLIEDAFREIGVSPLLVAPRTRR